MSGGFWLNYFLALFVIGLMLLGLWVLVRGLSRGRIFASASKRMVTVLESTALAQHVAVHVVKVGERYLLIGGGNNGTLSLLAELPPEEVDTWLAAQRETLGKASWQNFMGPLRPRL
jgi:flagellar biogenesis protein FliO